MAEPQNIVTAGSGVVVHLAVSDGVGALEFYKTVAGTEEYSRVYAQAGNQLFYASPMINGGPFMLDDFFPEFGHTPCSPRAIVPHLQVDDVDRWWQRAVDAGCTVAMPLEKQFWGDRYGQLFDPFGARWSLAQAV